MLILPWILAKKEFKHPWILTKKTENMNRIIDLHLERWVTMKGRKPLLLRGARQVGKTFAARKLSKKFETFIEINFEKSPKFKPIFDGDLDPKRLTRILASEFDKAIIPGKTLIFFDEIQEAPRALIALRYFYEEMPELHILAAGSLLHLAIEQVGVPVGRVSFFHVYPLSWFEFLKALDKTQLIERLLNHSITEPFDEFLHNSLFESLSEYMAIGGMPEAVYSWVENKDPKLCQDIHQSIIDTYINDFPKYAKKLQIKYVELLFDKLGLQLGQKFTFSRISEEYRKRDLFPSLELLSKADLAHIIYHTSAQGVPIGSQINLNKFKVISLDIGLTQSILGTKLSEWFIHPKENFINKGGLTEAFVGQELIAYQNPFHSKNLYYWQRETKNSQAEIDYLIQSYNQIIPIEVKSDKGNSLKSMFIFLENHPLSKYGVRFSMHNFSIYDKIYSYPLYAILNFLRDHKLFENLI